MAEFILERYNYWIVILLMMAGLFIVFSATNYIKRLVGLSIFQTSVFLFYITLGKVRGGTAPILVGDIGHGAHDDHGAHEEAGAHGAHAADEAHADAGHGADSHATETHGEPALSEPYPGDAAEAPAAVEVQTPDVPADLPDLPGVADVSGGVAGPSTGLPPPPPEALTGSVSVSDAGVTLAIDGVLYSNPLPHVLILTAIVVGVATLAVGLAISVRVREAYGTIEGDEIRRADLANMDRGPRPAR